jgi:uncharacterized protein
MITEVDVRKIFKGLEQGDGAGFFEHVDDKVDWIVEGTHPLAGHYKSKSDFVAGTFAKLAEVLPRGAQLVVEHLLVKDDQAVVELHSLATAKNGLRFDNLVLLGLPLCEWHDSGGSSISRFRPRGAPVRRESDLAGVILRRGASPSDMCIMKDAEHEGPSSKILASGRVGHGKPARR